MPSPFCPTLPGFIAWAQTVMGITESQLPSDSVFYEYAFYIARDTVNKAIQRASQRIYMLAVYNLAGDNLINFAQDPGGAPDYKDGLTFFNYMRVHWNIDGFVSGIVQSASDESTSVSLVVMEAAKNFTLSNLQNLKTPWGRQYLAWAQDYGTLWGFTP